MTQRLDQMNSVLSANQLNRSKQLHKDSPISAFDQPEIQQTLEQTELKPEQLTHIPDWEKIPASTKRIKPLNNFLGQDRARASVEAGIALPYGQIPFYASTAMQWHYSSDRTHEWSHINKEYRHC